MCSGAGDDVVEVTQWVDRVIPGGGECRRRRHGTDSGRSCVEVGQEQAGTVKSGRSHGRRVGRVDVMLNGRLLLLLRLRVAVLGRLVMRMRIRRVVDVAGAAAAVAGAGVERRQVRPLRRRRRPERGDVGERRAVRRRADPAARRVRREGRRGARSSEHRRRRVGHGWMVVGPAAEESPSRRLGRRRSRRVGVERAGRGGGSTETVGRGGQQAATGVHHRRETTATLFATRTTVALCWSSS